MSKLHRLLASGAALAVAGAAAVATPASAASIASGTTNTKTTVFALRLGADGSALDLELLSDGGTVNTDAHNGPTSAATTITPASLHSKLLHLSLDAPSVTTQSPGGPSDVTGKSVSLSSLGVPAALATATLTVGALHSDVANGAHTSMSSASVSNLSIAGGGLLSVNSLSSTLGAQAINADADGARTVQVGTINVLDLGALLKGLNVDITKLPISSISALLAAAHVPVSGVPVNTDLSTYVAQLNAAVTALNATVSPTLNQVTATVDQTTKSVLGTAGVAAPSSTASVATVQQTVSQVQAKLADVVKNGLSALDAAPLVRVSPTSVGIVTKAGDTVADSTAQVTAGALHLTVAGVALPVLDATSVTSVVNGALVSANAALNSVLGTLNLPANLVSVSMLDKSTSVVKNGAYTQAAAGLAGLTVKVAAIDPAIVTGAVSKLTGALPSSVLGSALSQVPVPASTAMGVLNTALGAVAPLTGGAMLQIASVGGASTYTVAAAAATPGATPAASLPHTGAPSGLALGGVLLALAGAGLAVLRRRRVHAIVS